MFTNLDRIRNIGISAHIDSGKTTLTERILFYTQRIRDIHEVRGKDGVGAKMDSMELERERGITIQSAATYCSWQDHHVNIIDTPGHVDFTIEVERALRVLDGAILVLCSVAGVQSQSLTVDRQMKRYNVPRLAFVNKCDRKGANPVRVKNQLIEKLGHNAVLMQLPIGLEDDHRGVVDLVTMKAYTFDGEKGQEITVSEIPEDMVDAAREAREELLDAVSMFSDELMEAMLMEEDEPGSLTEEIIHDAIRKATIKLQITPVFMGSAYKNKGVQKLLDAVVRYLPAPPDIENTGLDLDHNEAEVPVSNDPEEPFIALAFKLEDGRYGQLTYIRVYQGTLRKGDTIYNARSQQKVKVGRLVRMHSDDKEDIEETCAGDIVALFGVDCYSGDTFTDGNTRVAMTSIHVPEPVISLTITPKDSKAQANMSKALRRFTKEDPTFRLSNDPETGETIIAGMGELHLDVYIERMKREYRAEVDVSPPRVAYREAISQRAEFDYTHKKQTGGSGQYGKVVGYIEPSEEGKYEFVDEISQGRIPKEYIPSVDKGFHSMLEKGRLIGAPIVGMRVVLTDGAYHDVDSSDNAFQETARGAFRATYGKAKPIVLEPLMKVALEGPTEFYGAMVGTLMQRRGMVLGSTESDGFTQIEAEVPLAEMFGYATALRSGTEGKAEFTMEFSRYAPAPQSVTEELIKKYEAEKASKAS
ncbi:MAG: elongation factor G [Alphaproteobacteria bacterium]|nr:elongation factor G [Alphaproteobacteria bacterium]MCB9796234.1 elongation factor G [Alphaproteobacteria bacterium]